MQTDAEATRSQEEPGSPSFQRLLGESRSLHIAIVGIFTILVFAVFYLARDLILPILIAVILALTLRPIVRVFARRHLPPVVTAILMTIALAGGAGLATYAIFLPVVDWIDQAPEIGRELRQKLADLRAPAEAIAEAEAEIQEVTKGAPDPTRSVVVEGPGFFSTAASGLLSASAMLAVSLLLLGFFLSSGDMFYIKLLQSFDRFQDKKRVLRILNDIEHEISRYLLTVALVNAGLGIVVGTGFYFLDMPSPQVWGVVVALANFMPYIGAILGVGAAAVVAIISFDSIGQALLIPAFYCLCTALEGQVVTPYVIGRRLRLNIVAVFISVAFWAWLWGIVGALIAVPILVMIKTICDHVDSLTSFGNFLTSAENSTRPDAESIAAEGRGNGRPDAEHGLDAPSPRRVGS
jgi:predicted PurR-regulated permease PerM